MSTVLEQRSLPEGERRRAPLLALVAGLLALYVPVFISLARTLWREEDYAHGPIILAVAVYLFWRTAKNGARMNFPAARKFILAPFFVLAAGLALYIVGLAQEECCDAPPDEPV